MTDPEDLWQQFEFELERLGLRLETLPGGGMATGPDRLEPLVTKLRGLAPGATWWEIFPDLPRHWEAGKQETWTTPYRPLGPFDYQTLPTGPALLIAWEAGGAEELESLISKARSAGWPVYGSGIAVTPSGDNGSFLAFVVLRTGTEETDISTLATGSISSRDSRWQGTPERATKRITSQIDLLSYVPLGTERPRAPEGTSFGRRLQPVLFVNLNNGQAKSLPSAILSQSRQSTRF